MTSHELARAAERFSKGKLWFYFGTAAAACVLLLASPCLGTTTSVSAVLSLKSGEAQAYHQQITQRLEVLNDPSIEDVFLESLPCTPYLLYRADLDPAHTKEYYHKNSVTMRAIMPDTPD